MLYGGRSRHWSCFLRHPDDQIQLRNYFGIYSLSGNKLRKDVVFGLLHEISESQLLEVALKYWREKIIASLHVWAEWIGPPQYP